MSLLWVCEMTSDRRIRLGTHLAFRWRNCDPIETACGRELDGERVEWVDADMVVAVQTPDLPLCQECAALTVAEVDEQYGKWQRGEAR